MPSPVDALMAGQQVPIPRRLVQATSHPHRRGLPGVSQQRHRAPTGRRLTRPTPGPQNGGGGVMVKSVQQGHRPMWTACVATGVLVGCVAALGAQSPGKVYGDGVSAASAVAVQALLDHPDSYVGKTVRVDGTVSAVCQSMGCWLEIGDPSIGRGIRFKVKDGVVVFPKDAAGRKAAAEGVFEQIATSPVREAHHDDPRARPADGTPVPVMPTDKIYWVRARGAILY